MNARLTIDRLAWDDWNRQHIAKHGVTPEEVNEVARGDPAVRETYKNRLQLIGPTRTGRMFAAVIGPVPNTPGTYYTFSARPASRQERRYHDQLKGRASP